MTTGYLLFVCFIIGLVLSFFCGLMIMFILTDIEKKSKTHGSEKKNGKRIESIR